MDDSARGTIFWEAERSDHGDAAGEIFDIEWISTVRVPFYMTRGLRNPWNANREVRMDSFPASSLSVLLTVICRLQVKIARDGIEIPPEIGSRLIDLFKKAAASWGAQRKLAR